MCTDLDHDYNYLELENVLETNFKGRNLELMFRCW